MRDVRMVSQQELLRQGDIADISAYAEAFSLHKSNVFSKLFHEQVIMTSNPKHIHSFPVADEVDKFL
jgi:hypothetical protein